MSLFLVTCVVTAAALIQSSGLMSNNILKSVRRQHPLHSQTTCKQYPLLTHAQYRICLKYPDVTGVALEGLEESLVECQYQFTGHRWDCSSLRSNDGYIQSPGPIYDKGYKETAFAVSLTSASVTTHVSRACAMGSIPACGCAAEMDDVTGDWVWRGCEENLNFAEFFTRKFLGHLSHESRDLRAHVNSHNIRVGRLVLRENVDLHCKCHGMSGGCEMKTCWKTAPILRSIGNILKSKYSHATKVASNNRVTNTRRKRFKSLKRRKRSIGNTNLVFFEKSPSFCEPIAELQTSGTSGRVCNATSDSQDNCQLLCCGRGYYVTLIYKKVRCDCEFHWCCHVTCRTCVVSEWTTICR